MDSQKGVANQVAEPKSEHADRQLSSMDAPHHVQSLNQMQLSFEQLQQQQQQQQQQLQQLQQQQTDSSQTSLHMTPNQTNVAPSIGQETNVISNDNQLARQQHTTHSSQSAGSLATQIQSAPQIKPLLAPEPMSQSEQNLGKANDTTTNTNVPSKQELQSQQQPSSPQKAVVTKVKLSDELNVFDWLRTKDIIYQIAEKAKNSVDSVITVLDPGMKEYLYSGGNINIIVISDSKCFVSPIRDAFQDVFGRATVVAAKYNPPQVTDEYPVKLATGFNEAIIVAKERIKKFRLDTSNIPQNQVISVVQPALVTTNTAETDCLKQDDNLQPQWFLTFCMVIEDPVLVTTMNSYSQFIPIDSDIVVKAKEAKVPPGFQQSSLGFAQSIDDLIATRLKLKPNELEEQELGWLKIWSGLDEERIIHDLSTSLAHMYRRKWNECVVTN